MPNVNAYISWGKLKFTIHDIAKKAEVSIATVSRAFSDAKNSVKQETREKIYKIADELNYTPNAIARSLASNSTKTIGVVLPEIQGEFFTDIIQGIDEIAYAEGYHMIVAGSHSQRNVIDSIMGFMGKSMVDGVILMVPNITNRVQNLLEKYNTPVVIITDDEEFQAYDTVGIDNFQGAYSIMQYLIKTLHQTKISIINGPNENNDAIKRKAGYTAALKDNGVEIKNEWIIQSDFTLKGGELACSRLLSLREKPDVILAANDMMALGCYRVARLMGISIPDKLGIVGFDHIMLSDFLHPKLTTVHVPIAELGKNAAAILFEKILKKKEKEPQHIKISTGVIIGNSVKNIS